MWLVELTIERVTVSTFTRNFDFFLLKTVEILTYCINSQRPKKFEIILSSTTKKKNHAKVVLPRRSFIDF